MNKMNKSSILSLLSYIVALAIILNCNTVYTSSNLYGVVGKYIFYMMIVSSLLFIVLTIKEKKLKVDLTLLSGIFFTIYLGIFFLLINKTGSFTNNLRYIMIFFTIFLLVWVEKKEKNLPTILMAYINIMVVIGIISILFWLIGTTFHIIKPTGSVTLTWGYPYKTVPSYYNLYFEAQNYNLSIRNTAIFVEAPMAALNFLMALCLEIYFLANEKFYRLKIAILLIAGLLTLSTTFYIGVIILIIFKILSIKYNKDTKFIQILLLISVVPLLIYLSHILLGEKLDSNSGVARSIDYANAISAWIAHPFFGNGLDAGVGEIGNIVDGISIGHYGYSSSFAKILGDGGIFLLILPTLAVILSLKKWNISKNIGRLVITLIVIYLFFTIIFVQSYLFMYIIVFLAIWSPTQINDNLVKENSDKNI